MNTNLINESWFLLDTGPASAAFNMALDEKLLTLAPSLSVGGILRFYWFQPPAVTLGYFQKPISVNQAACSKEGISIVRRLTGGRAVFHHQELTYSVILPANNYYFGSGVATSFRHIVSAWQVGFQNLGIKTEIEKGEVGSKSQREANCFMSCGRYELKVEGKKLLGSAQVRKNGYLLQHGSVYLRYLPQETTKYLNPKGESQDISFSDSKVADLFTLLKRQVSRKEVKTAALEGFSTYFKIKFITSLSKELINLEASSDLSKSLVMVS